MTKYRINYTLSNDYDIIIEAKNKKNAIELVRLDPDNQYDWWKINYIVELEKDNEIKQKLRFI